MDFSLEYRVFQIQFLRSIKLYTLMEHPIISQKMTLTVFWSLFCEQNFKRIRNHRYSIFFVFDLPSLKTFLTYFFTSFILVFHMKRVLIQKV